MNRLFAQIFAFTVGAIHVAVLLGLGLLLLGTLMDWRPPVPVGDLASEVSGGLTPAMILAMVFVGYVLVMGIVSTLIAINQNLERLARDADRRGGYEVNT